ncbi:MAG: 16S rRNA methyltransferase [Gammaproteobacteria bacterium]|nr:MAG: 16S rRNA methyltransferase [Gammaproteobacteria bacterium]
MKNSLYVCTRAAELQEHARQLASRLGLSLMPCDDITTGLVLECTPQYLQLRDVDLNTEIHVDFTSGVLAHRKKYGGGRGQTIAKAIGMKQGQAAPSILDATAGLAKDAFVLACLGCAVTLIERSPIVAALVQDAIERAAGDSEFGILLAQGFHLINQDARSYMQAISIEQQPDVVYLDPMYPERKKSALVKKNMQILQKLLGQDEDTEQLLNAALACARKRVVVKRPKGAETIAGRQPTLSYESKNTRYDVYVNTQKKPDI